MPKKNNGITLIALVVTIVVILILAGVSITTIFNTDGVMDSTETAAFSSKIEVYKGKVESYVLTQEMNRQEGEELDVNVRDPEQMKAILGGIDDEEAKKYVIQNNELRYNPDYVTKDEKQWLAELGVLAMTVLYILTYTANGTTYRTIWADTVRFPKINPTSTEGSFQGWYYDVGTKKEAHEGDLISGDITLYAKWGNFKASFMVNGEIYEEIEGENLEYPLLNPTVENKRFDGWYYDESCTQIANAGDKLTEDVIIYAKLSSYIKNKLEGKYICMLSYNSETGGDSSPWRYVNSVEELMEDPLYSKVMSIGGGNYVREYPAWVKLRKI